ncbi:membrane protein [Neisseria bacilliformis]|uniref:HvfA family oxazolone/thioamide-modified RiPP metallophore n=1 Tax=Neisseria bacilliformis TaxID=267212 RepID=UPI000666FABF|nr:membrane protein [Neisseria bacilliformis]
MKKSSAIALAGALALTLGTQAVAAPAVNKTVKAKAKTKAAEGKCGASSKAAEGKCGEGKCGSKAPATKAAEGKCGEGKCGSH